MNAMRRVVVLIVGVIFLVTFDVSAANAQSPTDIGRDAAAYASSVIQPLTAEGCTSGSGFTNYETCIHDMIVSDSI